ncbi:MAG: hypothetical protein ACRCXC_04815 [Legionella sp.]
MIDFIKKNKTYPRLGLKLFSQFGEGVLEHIAVSELIVEAQGKELQLFVAMGRKLEEKEFK